MVRKDELYSDGCSPTTVNVENPVWKLEMKLLIKDDNSE